jgi:hypothetical protein
MRFSVHTTVTCPKPDTLWGSPQGDVELMTQKKVLPSGMRTSDDPFPAARSAAYAKSYDLRTAEAKDYPRTVTGAKP